MDCIGRIGGGVNRKGVSLVAHADWSVSSKKRWCASATLEGEGQYWAHAPRQVVQPYSLLQELEEKAGPSGCILVGFDFPIGLPHRFAEKAGITDFLSWLARLGTGDLSDFFEVAEIPDEISLHRPFYPMKPGNTSRQQLSGRLGIEPFSDLLRECERPYPGRRAACPLFWTLGGQQVGKAALFGWKEVLVPALSAHADPGTGSISKTSAGRRFAIWPFSGPLESLLRPGSTVVVEIYPAEFYARLGVMFSARGKGSKSGKRDQGDRAAQATRLLTWASQRNLALEPGLERSILEGFGTSADGEDRFDAVIGLFGMLDVLSRRDPFIEPESDCIRAVEGWIFGQEMRPET
jgi:hypothetical protein